MMLAAVIIPISFVANVTRVIILVLITLMYVTGPLITVDSKN